MEELIILTMFAVQLTQELYTIRQKQQHKGMRALPVVHTCTLLIAAMAGSDLIVLTDVATPTTMDSIVQFQVKLNLVKMLNYFIGTYQSQF